MDESGSGTDRYQVLIVENDFEISDQLERILKNNKRFNCEVTTVAKGEVGLDYINDRAYDLVLSDYAMDDMDGIDFFRRLEQESSSQPLKFLIMEEEDPHLGEKAIRDGYIDGYIENPWNSQEVKYVVCQRLERIKVLDENERLDVDNVSEALETVKKFQDKITVDSETSTEKETLIFEFGSSAEFNKFSFELKRMKNIQILDVHIFEDKYVINVGLYPKSYEKIR